MKKLYTANKNLKTLNSDLVFLIYIPNPIYLEDLQKNYKKQKAKENLNKSKTEILTLNK